MVSTFGGISWHITTWISSMISTDISVGKDWFVLIGSVVKGLSCLINDWRWVRIILLFVIVDRNFDLQTLALLCGIFSQTSGSGGVLCWQNWLWENLMCYSVSLELFTVSTWAFLNKAYSALAFWGRLSVSKFLRLKFSNLNAISLMGELISTLFLIWEGILNISHVHKLTAHLSLHVCDLIIHWDGHLILLLRSGSEHWSYLENSFLGGRLHHRHITTWHYQERIFFFIGNLNCVGSQ